MLSLKGPCHEIFDPFLVKKNSIWTPYEQAKTIYLEVVFVFRKIFMKTYVHWLLLLLLFQRFPGPIGIKS